MKAVVIKEPPRERIHLSVGDYMNYALLVLVALVCVLPFLYVISISLTDPQAYVPFKLYLIPEKISLASYQYILATNSFTNSLKSTAFITVVGTIVNLITTFSMAYGLTKTYVPGYRVIYGMVILTLFFSAGVIPTYLMIKNYGLLNSQWSLILGSMTSAWYLVVARNFLLTIPASLEEAACLDGCSEIGTFIRVILPLSMPAIATLTLFFAVAHWNTYFNAMLYISDTKKWTLQLLIKQLVIDSDGMGIGQAVDTDSKPPQETMRMAAVILAMIPIVIVYPFLQKHFAKGVMMGSIKG